MHAKRTHIWTGPGKVVFPMTLTVRPWFGSSSWDGGAKAWNTVCALVTSPNYAYPEEIKKNNRKQLESKVCVWQTVKLVVVYMLIDDDLDVADTLELEPGGKFECIR